MLRFNRHPEGHKKQTTHVDETIKGQEMQGDFNWYLLHMIDQPSD